MINQESKPQDTVRSTTSTSVQPPQPTLTHMSNANTNAYSSLMSPQKRGLLKHNGNMTQSTTFSEDYLCFTCWFRSALSRCRLLLSLAFCRALYSVLCSSSRAFFRWAAAWAMTSPCYLLLFKKIVLLCAEVSLC